MFTGIVEQVGSIVSRAPRGPGARLVVSTGFRDLVMGESIAVSGVCLTVDAIRTLGSGQSFEADASVETLERTTLRSVLAGARVNLERALRPDSRLGGHFVGGHVDACGALLSKRPAGEAVELRFSLPRDVARFVAKKGSIAIDGVSLTVNHVQDPASDSEPGWFDVVVIPHTLRATTLVDLVVGAQVNLEVDVLARYVARHLALPQESPRHEHAAGASDQALLDALRGGGWL